LQDQKYIQENSKIHFNVNSLPYDNLIPSYICPRKQYQIHELNNPITINIKEFKSRHRIDFPFHSSSFDTAHDIWNKYFSFSEEILQQIPDFDGTCTVGIHYRGTDKNRDLSQANPITHDDLFVIMDDFLENNKHIHNIYCCSDEQAIIDKIIEKYSNMSIYNYNQKRSDTDTEAFFRKGQNVDKIEQHSMTIAALVDMIALSKCNTILKTSSALSAFSKIINPDLNLYAMSAMKQPWFPTGVVKSYTSSSAKVNEILSRTMQGHVYATDESLK